MLSAWRAIFVLQSSDFAAGAAGTYFAYYFVLQSYDFAAGAAGTCFGVRLLYLKVATLQPELRGRASRTAFVPSCDFAA